MYYNVLFVCYANAGRSQLAEAILKRLQTKSDLLKEKYIDVFSGGLNPAGYIVKDVIKICNERGLDISGQYSKSFLDVPIDNLDFVINMSNCEIFSYLHQRDFKGELIEWNVPDPIGTGIDAYRKTTDLIEKLIISFIKEKL